MKNKDIIYKYYYQGKKIATYNPKMHFSKNITLDDWKNSKHLVSIKSYNENLYNDIFKNKSKRYIIARDFESEDKNHLTIYILISEGTLKPTPDYLMIQKIKTEDYRTLNCRFIHNPEIVITKEAVKEDNEHELFNKKIDFSKIKNGDEFKVNKLGLTFYKIAPRNLRAEDITMLPKDSNINPREYVVIGENDDGPDIIIQNKSSGNKIALYHDPNEIVRIRNTYIKESTDPEGYESYETLFETAINEIGLAAVGAGIAIGIGAQIFKQIRDKNARVKNVMGDVLSKPLIIDGKQPEYITLKRMYDTIRKYGTKEERKHLKKFISHYSKSKDQVNKKKELEELLKLSLPAFQRSGIKIKNVPGYLDAKIGDKFIVDDSSMIFEKITPRMLTSSERNSICNICRDIDEMDHFKSYVSYKVIGLWNGGTSIILGNENGSAYLVDFEMSEIDSVEDIK